MSNIILHRGGWSASRTDLEAVPVPEATKSYTPVPNRRFIEEVLFQLPRYQLSVHREQYALGAKGSQMFGVLTCTNCIPSSDYTLAIGLRNSYDKSTSVGLAVGSRVFICDNLAFSGEVTSQRRHTPNVFRDLPDIIYQMLSRVSAFRNRMDSEIAVYKQSQLDDRHADHLIMRCIRSGVIPPSRLPYVIVNWDKPLRPEFEPRTAWSLLNAFTDTLKQSTPRDQLDCSLLLNNIFRKEFVHVPALVGADC